MLSTTSSDPFLRTVSLEPLQELDHSWRERWQRSLACLLDFEICTLSNPFLSHWSPLFRSWINFPILVVRISRNHRCPLGRNKLFLWRILLQRNFISVPSCYRWEIPFSFLIEIFPCSRSRLSVISPESPVGL